MYSVITFNILKQFRKRVNEKIQKAHKFKLQGAISLIKPSKGTVKLELFNLLTRFDHLFISFSFHMKQVTETNA